jgi:hypothetical protein
MGRSSVTRCVRESLAALVVDTTHADRIHGRWFTSVDPALTLIVTAVPSPNTEGTKGKVQWTSVPAGTAVNRDVATIPRTPAGGPYKVTAQLNNSKSIDLYFVEILTLVCENGTSVGADTWKYYVGNGNAEITATPNPDWYRYRNRFRWSWNLGSRGKSNRRRLLPLNAAGDYTVTATLYSHSKSLTVRVCEVPILQVNKLTFGGGHTINCDTLGNFDNIWEDGRADPAAPVNPAAGPNSPLCYTRDSRIQITAKFNVTTHPTEQENVTIKGTANFGGRQLTWEHQNLQVNSGDADVTTPAMTSDRSIPDKVACYENLAITWKVTGPDGVTRDAGQTTHTVYATLAAPAGGNPLYWTLLDISYRAAAGATSEEKLVSKAYAPFRNATGDGNGLRRLRDDQELSYYLNGVNTSSVDVFATKDLLQRADGTARCGAWGSFLVDMCKIHGITSVAMFGIKPRANQTLILVENCTFTGNGTISDEFTHRGTVDCVKQDGVAGQGKTNPQFIFGDHALVEFTHNGTVKIYDPSYGTGPWSNIKKLGKKSIAGLGDANGGYTQFYQGATRQFITDECSRGFIRHTVTAGQTVADIARLYAVRGGANALYNHAYNYPLRQHRAAIALVTTGDVVIIPRDTSNISIMKRG